MSQKITGSLTRQAWKFGPINPMFIIFAQRLSGIWGMGYFKDTTFHTTFDRVDSTIVTPMCVWGYDWAYSYKIKNDRAGCILDHRRMKNGTEKRLIVQGSRSSHLAISSNISSFAGGKSNPISILTKSNRIEYDVWSIHQYYGVVMPWQTIWWQRRPTLGQDLVGPWLPLWEDASRCAGHNTVLKSNRKCNSFSSAYSSSGNTSAALSLVKS